MITFKNSWADSNPYTLRRNIRRALLVEMATKASGWAALSSGASSIEIACWVSLSSCPYFDLSLFCQHNTAKKKRVTKKKTTSEPEKNARERGAGPLNDDKSQEEKKPQKKSERMCTCLGRPWVVGPLLLACKTSGKLWRLWGHSFSPVYSRDWWLTTKSRSKGELRRILDEDEHKQDVDKGSTIHDEEE